MRLFDNDSGMCGTVVTPLQGLTPELIPVPRALPWAVMLRPFGALLALLGSWSDSRPVCPFGALLRSWSDSRPVNLFGGVHGTQNEQSPVTPRDSSSTVAGFTLVEVLVALAILGIALFVLLDAHYGALRLLSNARDQDTMRSLLERAVAEAEIEVLAGNLSGSGDFGNRYPQYRYSFDAALADERLAMYHVTVSFTAPENKTTQMNLLVYDTR
jgi:prepilin-type N-terminal cleavage/methylation domain-containing protein